MRLPPRALPVSILLLGVIILLLDGVALLFSKMKLLLGFGSWRGGLTSRFAGPLEEKPPPAA